MKKGIGILFILASASLMASVKPSLPFSIDTNDKPALQRGARFYMNYCSGCHALKYMRYNQMASALGLTTFEGKVKEDLLQANLVFTKASVYDPIKISLPPEEAKQWFGVVPPDLSLITRARGPAWLYTFLTQFYEDSARPFHTNNLLFPDVGMPDVLAPLRGTVVRRENAGGHVTLVRVSPGSMDEQTFEQALRDLTTFLSYVGEPKRHERHVLGVGVLLFLGLALVLAWLLKKEIWKRLK